MGGGRVEATGELYAKDPVSDRFIVLGEFDTRYEAEEAMPTLRPDWNIGLLEWFGLTGEEEA